VSRGEQATVVGDVKMTRWRFEEPSSSFERSPTMQWTPPDMPMCSGWPGGAGGAPLWLATRRTTSQGEEEKDCPCSVGKPSLL